MALHSYRYDGVPTPEEFKAAVEAAARELAALSAEQQRKLEEVFERVVASGTTATSTAQAEIHAAGVSASFASAAVATGAAVSASASDTVVCADSVDAVVESGISIAEIEPGVSVPETRKLLTMAETIVKGAIIALEILKLLRGDGGDRVHQRNLIFQLGVGNKVEIHQVVAAPDHTAPTPNVEQVPVCSADAPGEKTH